MSDRNLEHLYPAMRAKFLYIIKDLQDFCDANYPNLGLEPFLTEGYRFPAYQNSLWRKGRFTRPLGKQYVVTNCDGYIKKSKHQSGLAFDIMFRYKHAPGHLVSPVPLEVWEYYGHLCRKYGMVWGGDWKSFGDKPHCEWPATDKVTYKLAKDWVRKNVKRGT